MIILFIPFKGVYDGGGAGFKVNLTNGCSIVGIDKDVCVASLDQELVGSVSVKIKPSCEVKIFLGRSRGWIFQFVGQAVCLAEVGEQRGTQVWRVKPSEDAVPVSVVALDPK